jgi:hypothetical protein
MPGDVPMTDPAQKHWLIRPATIRGFWRFGWVVLALLVLGDFFIHGHPVSKVDGTFGFYAWYGFAACVAMVLFSKAIGAFLKRADTYYDDR